MSTSQDITRTISTPSPHITKSRSFPQLTMSKGQKSYLCCKDTPLHVESWRVLQSSLGWCHS